MAAAVALLVQPFGYTAIATAKYHRALGIRMKLTA